MTPKLPEVEHSLPWVVRLVLIALGVAVAVLPARDLARALWPPSIMGLLFGVIVIGAALLGLLLVVAGLFGEAQRWSYPPRTIVIHRRRWRGQSQTRLMARDISAINIKHHRDSEAPDIWRVELVQRDSVPPARESRRMFQVRTALETRGFATQEEAEAARQMLLAHLGIME